MKKFTILTLALLFAVSSVSFAADNESWIQKIKNRFQKKDATKTAKPITPAKTQKPSAPPAKTRKDMTKGELAADITKNLDREESILNMVPGLEKKTDPEGKDYYTYQGTRIEDIDRDSLEKIFGRVRNEALRLRTDKLNKQLETVRRANAVTATVPQIPKSPVPAAVARPPQTPRAVQVPSRPPAPPRR